MTSAEPDGAASRGSAAKAADLTQARISDYAISFRFENLPREVVGAASLCVADTLGAMIGGFSGEPGRIARILAETVTATPGATVVGSQQTTSAELAAFANATAARYLEYTDYYHRPGALDGHASDVVAAVLAAAEVAGSSGRDVLAATVLGYEIFLRLCDVFPRGGFDYTNCTVLGSAVAAGWLLRLNPEQMRHCISIAVVPNVILKQVRREGKTGFKPAATGHAARAGVFAAQLAKAGMDGPNLPFEGSFGFCQHVLGRDFPLDRLGGEEQEGFRILDSRIKIRPSERNTVPLILAAERLSPVAPGDVSTVTIEIYRRALEEVGSESGIWNPRSKNEAYHSIPYVVAATLAKGSIDLQSFDEAHLHSRDIRTIMGLITLVENPEFTLDFNGTPVRHRARITLTMSDGAIRLSEADDHARPDTDPFQIATKFLSLTKDRLGASRSRAIFDQLMQLDEIESIPGLLGDFAH
jgi:2-methylcitrate dehydratase